MCAALSTRELVITKVDGGDISIVAQGPPLRWLHAVSARDATRRAGRMGANQSDG